MAEHSNSPAETDLLIGELRAILKDKGVKVKSEGKDEDGGEAVSEGTDPLGVLRAAIETLKRIPKQTYEDRPDAENEDAENEAAEIAASVRKRLGLADNASKAETLFTLSKIDIGGLQGRQVQAETDLAVAREAERDRVARELVEHNIKINKINPNDKDQYAAALAFAKDDPERFVKIMGLTTHYIAPGRTEPPTPGQCERARVINSATREFHDSEQLRKMTNKKDHAALALRDAGLPVLTEDEIKSL